LDDGTLSSNGATISILVSAPNLGPVAHWTLDDGSGPYAADATGNGSQGTLVGNPSWVSGVLEGGLDFGNSGDAVAVSPADSLNNLDALTISMWFFADSTGEFNQGKFLTKDDAFDLRFSTYNSKIYFDARRWTGDWGQWRLTTEDRASLLGSWHHLGITYDYSSLDNDPVMYLDGARVANIQELVAPSGAVGNEAAALILGNKPDYSRAFDGVMDDVRIYDRILSEWEMLEIFQTGSGAP
jgi:hypothetical protein